MNVFVEKYLLISRFCSYPEVKVLTMCLCQCLSVQYRKSVALITKVHVHVSSRYLHYWSALEVHEYGGHILDSVNLLCKYFKEYLHRENAAQRKWCTELKIGELSYHLSLFYNITIKIIFYCMTVQAKISSSKCYYFLMIPTCTCISDDQDVLKLSWQKLTYKSNNYWLMTRVNQLPTGPLNKN